uniref:Uncharacterized protein n=1 Tax=Anguilla anguilla TaxID=7936 RepID=A0A0E9Q7U2_ANGAN
MDSITVGMSCLYSENVYQLRTRRKMKHWPQKSEVSTKQTTTKKKTKRSWKDPNEKCPGF